MSTIILAYIAGVLCGMGYMYLRYSKRLREHARDLDKMACHNAWMHGRLDALYVMSGLELDTYAGDENTD